MNNKNQWSRRKFSKAVISAQLLLASGILSIPLGCARDKSSIKKPLDESMQETLKYAIDEIIPANEKMPSASEVGGVDYIIGILQDLPDLAPLFEAIIDEIEDHSKERAKNTFIKLERMDRVSVLMTVEKVKPELFKVLKDFTYECYYTSATVYNLINYEPYPTGGAGPEMEPFDEKLLNRVKNLPPMYIKI
jgi:hypothetical protein